MWEWFIFFSTISFINLVLLTNGNVRSTISFTASEKLKYEMCKCYSTRTLTSSLQNFTRKSTNTLQLAVNFHSGSNKWRNCSLWYVTSNVKWAINQVYTAELDVAINQSFTLKLLPALPDLCWGSDRWGKTARGGRRLGARRTHLSAEEDDGWRG